MDIREDSARMRWLESVAGGRVSVEPIAGGGQRHTYFVSVESDGVPREQVLQVESSKGPYAGRDVTSLARQARLLSALRRSAASEVAPELIALHPDEDAILTARVPGDSEFAAVPAGPRRQALTRDFVSKLALLHSVDADSLDIAGLGRQEEVSDARRWVSVWNNLFAHVERPVPVVRFGLRWLTDHAPENDVVSVVCHGDVGPGNFMIHKDRVSRLIDWELAHIGDFHDDLGMLALRGFQLEGMEDFNGMLAHYANVSGRTVSAWKVRYYRAVALTLGVVTSLVQLDQAVAGGRNLIAMPLYLHLVPMLQLWLAEALIDLAGLQPDPVDLPEADIDLDLLDTALALGESESLLQSLAASGSSHTGFADILAHLDADARYSRSIKAAELEDLHQLLGERPDDVWQGRRLLDQRLAAGDIDDADLLQWSYRSAKRQSLRWPAWSDRFQRPLIPIPEDIAPSTST